MVQNRPKQPPAVDANAPSSAAYLLEAAARLLTPSDTWTREYYARDENGEDIPEFSERAVCWCATGAIWKVSGYVGNFGPDFDARAVHEAVRFLAKVVAGPRANYTSVVDWNDADGRKKQQVVTALRKAAVLASLEAEPPYEAAHAVAKHSGTNP